MSDEPEATTPDEIPSTEDEWEASLAEDEGDEPAADADAPSEDAPSADDAGDAPAPEATDAGSEPVAAEPAADTDEPASGDAPAPDADALPDGETPDEPRQSEPYTLRADGRDIELTGAVRTFGDDGQAYIVIPESSVERQLKHNIADRSVWQAELKRLQEERSDNEVKADGLVEHFKNLLEADEDGSALWTWLQDFKANKDNLSKDLEIAVLKKQAANTEARTTVADQAVEDRAYKEWAPGALRGAVDGVLKLKDFDGLGLDGNDLYEEIAAMNAEQVFFTATAKEVAERPWGMTFVEGNVYPNYTTILRIANGQAAVVRKEKTRVEEAAAAKEANRLALEGGDDGKPVAAAGETAVVGGKKGKAPSTRDEWEASLLEDD